MVKRVLFYRDFKDYTGGHQKVADYFNHLRASAVFLPDISFSSRTRWDDANPWYPEFVDSNVKYSPDEYDYIFLAGTDWEQYLVSGNVYRPIINLIQHVRHATPSADVYPYLTQKAIRICVSKEVETAILGTGMVNGPTYVIPNGIEVPEIKPDVSKTIDVLVLGNKSPDTANKLAQCFEASSLNFKVITSLIPKKELLSLMASAKIFVGLPNLTEGFYLPALEAMALSDLVVVPDCIGNRSFCIDFKTCLLCKYDFESLVDAIKNAIQLLDAPHIANEIKANARERVKQHSLVNERELFLNIMNDVESIWGNKGFFSKRKKYE